MAKKFYWLKLKEDFFRDKRIKKLRKIAGGDTYTVIYLKIQLLSLKNNGAIIFEGVEENLAEELALDIDEDVDNVKVTLAFLQQNGLIEETETDHYIMTETIKCIGSEGASAERVRKYRELKENKQKALQCNDAVTTCNTEIEIENREQDKELELEQDKELKKDKKTVANATSVLSIEESLFNDFWSEYPKKINKKGAFAAFKKIKNIKEEIKVIMAALDSFKKSKEWQKSNGQFIPYPTTFINQERWKDQQQVTREDQLKTIDMEGWV